MEMDFILNLQAKLLSDEKKIRQSHLNLTAHEKAFLHGVKIGINQFVNECEIALSSKEKST